MKRSSQLSHEDDPTPAAPLLFPLTQRKELGVTVFNCSCLALDLHRVFLFYWQLHDRDYIPSIWSKRVTALYGRHDGLELQLNSSQAVAYVSVSNNSTLLRKALRPQLCSFLWSHPTPDFCGYIRHLELFILAA